MSAFLSYSRANDVVALQIARELRASGVVLWVDKLDISAGQHWDSEIHGALRTATHVVALLSKQSVASSQVLDELRYALEAGKRVVPVLLEPCDRPPGIIRLQYIDLAQGLEHTLEELRKALAPAPSPPDSTPVSAPGPSPSPADTAPTLVPVLAAHTNSPPVRTPVRQGSRVWLPIAGGVGAAVAIGVAVWLGRGGERAAPAAAAPAPAPPTTTPAAVAAAPVAAVPSAAVSVPAPAPATAGTEPPAAHSVAAFAGYRIDVFWCDESGAKAEALAGQIRAQIDAGTRAERVRTRKLSFGQGPWASGYEVRVDPDGSELLAGYALQKFLANRQPGISFTGWKSPEATPNYLSVFVCPGARSDADLAARTRHF